MVGQLVKKQHEKARTLLMENREKLHELTQYRYERETITGAGKTSQAVKKLLCKK